MQALDHAAFSSPTQAAFVGSSGDGFVVEAEDDLAAAVVLRVFGMPSGLCVGFVAGS